MQNLELTEIFTLSGRLKPFQKDCISDMDNFIKNLSEIKTRNLRPDLIGSIITHYASKWLPELAADEAAAAAKPIPNFPESATVSLSKKRFVVESVTGVLPPEKDSVPCGFLLRLLRAASAARVDATYAAELERRVSWQLDQASLRELMIPAFSHTSATLLDVALVTRLVERFVRLEEASRSGVAVMKVAKLVDGYLAEAAVDACLGMPEFVALAAALPAHARATNDGLYRAVDTYLKAHPGVPKQERKTLCSLIDCNKLSQEACLHAAQNERLPVRAVIQVLLSEQSKLINKHADWSGGSLSSPGPDLSSRCFSRRETSVVQQMEIRRLKEDVLRLQSQCMAMERQIERALEKRRGSHFFSWKRFGILGFRGSRIAEEFEEESEAGFGPKTPVKVGRGRTPKRRKSLS